MTDRVLIKTSGPSVLRVSMPGYDVNTATLDQIAFDAGFHPAHRFESGSVNVAGDANGNGQSTYFFATPQSNPPICLYIANPYPIGAGPGGSCGIISYFPTNPAATRQYGDWADVYANQVQFFIRGKGVSVTFQFRFMLLRVF